MRVEVLAGRMTAYDREWWQREGAGYLARQPRKAAHVEQERALVAVLGDLSFGSVLEVGVGFGRAMRAVLESLDVREYIATDFVREHVNAAADYSRFAVRRRNTSALFAVLDLDNPWAEDRTVTADVVLAVEVLMHRPPEKVAGDVETLLGLARRYIVTVDWYEDWPSSAVVGCYAHDYPALFAPFPVDVTVIPAARQAIYVTNVGP